MFQFLAITFLSVVALSSAKIETRIFGGSNAKQGEFPNHVAIQSPFSNNPFCGGSIFDKNTIITSASCVYGKGALQIVAGDLNKYDTSGLEQLIRVGHITYHENYDHATRTNDLALLKLQQNLVFNNNVAPLRTAYIGDYSSGTCVVTGWGVTANSASAKPQILQKGEVTIISDYNCQNAYASEEVISRTNICAKGKDSEVCNGDYGGPLMCMKSDGPYLAGVASYRHGPCEGNKYPGVYTEMSNYYNWVRNNA